MSVPVLTAGLDRRQVVKIMRRVEAGGQPWEEAGPRPQEANRNRNQRSDILNDTAVLRYFQFSAHLRAGLPPLGHLATTYIKAD